MNKGESRLMTSNAYQNIQPRQLLLQEKSPQVWPEVQDIFIGLGKREEGTVLKLCFSASVNILVDSVQDLRPNRLAGLPPDTYAA
eukprot:3586333-Amphidinium_carterae.1